MGKICICFYYYIYSLLFEQKSEDAVSEKVGIKNNLFSH
jgi:hypothetical protein